MCLFCANHCSKDQGNKWDMSPDWEFILKNGGYTLGMDKKENTSLTLVYKIVI